MHYYHRQFNISNQNIYFFLLLHSDITEILKNLKPIEWKGDPLLQLTILAACTECKEKLLLLQHVAIPAILWSIAEEIENSDDISNQVCCSLIKFV